MKKKLLFISVILSAAFSLFSEQYRIIGADYAVQGSGFKFLGTTRPYVLKQTYPVDTKKIFDDQTSLESYISNYEQSLINSRDFDSVDVTYETSLNEESEINEVTIKVSLVDSHHMLIVPYPKYSSDSGASLKLKARDSNFLGTLHTMNTTLNLKLVPEENDNGDETYTFVPTLSFDYDYPFSIGNVNATFINDYSLSYVVSDEAYKRGFEWDTKTGLSLSIPFELLPLNIGLYQYTGGDLDYKYYEEDESSYKYKNNEDYYYFSEELSVGTSFKLAEFSNYTTLSYSPSIGIKWHWDPDGINKDNGSLTSPTLSFSHSISNGKVNWNDNMRKGYSLSLSNSYSYNFQRMDLNPSVTLNGQFFWNYEANDQDYWNRYGIASKLHAFYYFEVPTNKYTKQGSESFHDDLRGVLSRNCGSYPAGLVLNLDLPHNVFTSDFTTQLINFNLQIAPFFDMAIFYDNNQSENFNMYNNGFYCGGVEFLVYPVKWSSITGRVSLGVDLKGAAQEHNFLEGISKNKEIFIGIGLQY